MTCHGLTWYPLETYHCHVLTWSYMVSLPYELTNAMPWHGLTWDLCLIVTYQCHLLTWSYMISLP
ncbi:hypothetical protein F383_32317 [Gossypium arboreum]|uniref:Uncharacterized protein n=1 Tax=Gossypium arboreum TaxID=29729 RepID=A0A0B0PRY6_GOSAR|nr:hypothetical protein F383_32317 [Gossypium arboreum]